MKKKQKQIKKILVGTGVLLALWLLSPISPALATNTGAEVNTCTILDKYDNESGRDSITLRSAIKLANKTLQAQRCRHSITIQKDVSLRAPLVISVSIVSDLPNDGDDSRYVIQGMEGGVVGEQIKIDATAMRDYNGSEARKCALILRGTHSIILKDIVLANVPAGFDGICMENGVNKVRLDNVKIEQVGDKDAEGNGGNGLVFDERAYDNEIMNGTSFNHITGGAAIVDAGADITGNNGADQKFNRIIATNRQVTGTDADGLSIFEDVVAGEEDATTVKNIHLSTILSGVFVSTPKPLQVRIEKVEQQGGQGSTKFKIKGSVVDTSATSDICQALPVSGSAEIKWMQIYAAQPGAPVSSAATPASEGSEGAGAGSTDAEATTPAPTQSIGNGEFYKYVMEKGNSSAGNGIDRTGRTQGKFIFIIDTAETGNMLVLVPELDTHTIAGTSRLFKVTDRYTDCEDGFNGRGGDGNGDGEGGVVGIDNPILNEGQCRTEGSIGASGLSDSSGIDSQTDSDGDGLSDTLEATTGSCDPNQGFSNWENSDSDGDGILDGSEIPISEGYVPITPLNRNLIAPLDLNGPRTTQLCAHIESNDGSVGSLTLPEAGKDPCDADNDGISNARDTDSDSDGLLDYEEDRQKTLNPWAHIKLTDPDGVQWDCPAQLATVAYTVGQAWGVFEWKSEDTVAPVLHDFVNGGLRDGYSLIRTACKNLSLIQSDLNGRVDGRSESNAYKVDTDNDGVCDGHGVGCQTCVIPLGADTCTPTPMTKFEDNCPQEYDADNACALPCQPNEDLYRVCYATRNRTCADQYLVFDANDNPTGLKMNPATNVASLYEVADWHTLTTICSDLDHDTIPDCVERMDPLCGQESTQSSGSLSPHKQDTDGDDVNDNFDLNPFEDLGAPGRVGDDINDDPSPVTDANRESLMSVFRIAQIPLLRCFVNRDQDGLTDCEEDVNKNDHYDTISSDLQIFLNADLNTVECNPLKADSDDDGLGDAIERQTSRTNCQSKDTDGDHLSDRAELIADAGDNYADQSGRGCSAIKFIAPNTDTLSGEAFFEAVKDHVDMRLGTNPLKTDTDEDGIPDNVEVTCQYLSTHLTGGGNLLANGFPDAGVDICSNPLAKNSDNDGLPDAEEYAKSGADGVMSYNESSPCDANTDSEGNDDASDLCPTSDDPHCTAVGTDGNDSDGDHLSNDKEALLGTYPNNPDSDGDSVFDGDEVGSDGILQIAQGDTDPRCLPLKADGSCVGFDTDSDGLSDGVEKRLGTNANDPDTDHDCIPDGVEVNFNAFSNFTGTDTNPTTPDSDGDGLCDGNTASTNGGVAGTVNCVPGEDAGFLPGSIACNGRVDFESETHRPLETDPRLIDSDHDTVNDNLEVLSGGNGNIAANIGRATQGSPGGCLNLGGTAEGTLPNMILQLSGLFLLMWNRVKRRLKK